MLIRTSECFQHYVSYFGNQAFSSTGFSGFHLSINLFKITSKIKGEGSDPSRYIGHFR
jgi:hypothetical protein